MAGGVAQGEGPEFKSQYHKKKLPMPAIFQIVMAGYWEKFSITPWINLTGYDSAAWDTSGTNFFRTRYFTTICWKLINMQSTMFWTQILMQCAMFVPMGGRPVYHRGLM
jgi:hypothetical protein